MDHQLGKIAVNRGPMRRSGHRLIVLVDPLSARVYKSQIWLFSDQSYLMLQFRRMPLIVGVQVGDHITGTVLDPAISGSRQTGVCLVDDLDSGLIRANDFCEIVSGTVVDDDDFRRPVGLLDGG